MTSSTGGTSASWVQVLRELACTRRMPAPITSMAASRQPPIMAARLSRRFISASFSGDIGGSSGMGFRTPAQHPENGGDKKKGGDSGESQAADHGTAQGRILFAPLAQAKRHGRHAD